MKTSIDNLVPTRSLIDLSAHSDGASPLIEGYTLTSIYDDILLVKPMDESTDGDAILKGGVYIPKNAVGQSWRVGKVLLVGPSVRNTKVGECVIFPNDRGLTVKNVRVKGIGLVKSGYFLNEERLFGTCEPPKSDEDSSTDS
jgi:hypothetical protein